MPPAITRNDAPTRRLATDLLEQWRTTTAWLRELRPEDFARPTAAGPGEDVRDLVGHLLYAMTDLQQVLENPTTRRPDGLLAHLRTQNLTWSRTQDLTRRAIGRETGPSLVRQLQLVSLELERQLSGDLAAAYDTLSGPLRTPDVLKSATLEIVQHSDDLAEALQERPALALSRGALFTAVRVVTECLAQAHAGRSVELRVPPAAAVQVASPDGDGPVHTRGTPPTVVEMDPRVLLRLASGRLSWADANRQHLLVASGAHADLSSYFPLVHL